MKSEVLARLGAHIPSGIALVRSVSASMGCGITLVLGGITAVQFREVAQTARACFKSLRKMLWCGAAVEKLLCI